MIGITLLILAINIVVDEAGVIKILNNENNFIENTTASTETITTTLEPEQTTVTDQDPTVTPTETLGALSRDEEATILIFDQSLSYSAPDELVKTEPETIDLRKSGKLLLLSTAKIAEKPKEPEENLEESEEDIEVIENVTEIDVENTTAIIPNEDTTTNLIVAGAITEHINADFSQQHDFSTEKEITKLYPINDTLYSDNNKTHGSQTKESPIAIGEVLPKESFNLNVHSVVLEEPEADYIFADSEALHGSYADVDSELHLQPIVQSIEIVPSSLDDTSFINYVQTY